MQMARWGAVGVGLLVLALIPIWVAYGALTPGADHGGMAVDLETFQVRAQTYATEHRLADGSVQGVADSAIPVLVQQYGFVPGVLRLRTGETYTLELASRDVLHGFSLQMGSGSLNAEVMPGMMMMLELTPTQPGEYLFLCNEYCGVGHQYMSGKIVVEGPPVSRDAVQGARHDDGHDHEHDAGQDQGAARPSPWLTPTPVPSGLSPTPVPSGGHSGH